MKKIIAISLLTIPFLAHAGDESDFCKGKEINIGGFSHHWTKESDYAKSPGYNERNYGMGFTCQLSGLGSFKDEIEVGFVQNSFDKTAVYSAYGLYYPLNPIFEVGFRNIIASGYEQAQVNSGGFLGGPLLAAKVRLTDRVSFNFSGVPSFSWNKNHFDGFIYVNMGIKF